MDQDKAEMTLGRRELRSAEMPHPMELIQIRYRNELEQQSSLEERGLFNLGGARWY